MDKQPPRPSGTPPSKGGENNVSSILSGTPDVEGGETNVSSITPDAEGGETCINTSDRIRSLRDRTLNAERYLSLDQARIITEVYRQEQDTPAILRRARALYRCLGELPIRIDPDEIIVGNRTPGIRSGIVFPEAGVSWLEGEIDTIQTRPQDPFNVKKRDREVFLNEIVPYWKGRTLEDDIYRSYGDEISAIEKVVKINQKDHAQGHICPDVKEWLRLGPSGLLVKTRDKLPDAIGQKKIFYESVALTLEGAIKFIRRYASLALEMADKEGDERIAENLRHIYKVCSSIAQKPPSDFREAVQSAWFLFVILHMESNASSFSPGRMDQYLYPYFVKDINSGKEPAEIQEIIDALFIKFNQIVYMRNQNSAKYFAGFPTGFNITIGGQNNNREDAVNELSFYFLRSQEHIRLPQPNLTARLCSKTSAKFILECSRIIGLGIGMPQVVNDESIIPSLEQAGIDEIDSLDYALVGCVELSTQGNFLGWSDAAMFNLVKALELTINNGICLLTGKKIGIDTGNISTYKGYNSLEKAFEKQIEHFTERMIRCCEVVEQKHQEHLPSPFLSSVINDCIQSGTDVTAGGAKYNFSGIQAIQAANVADSLAAIMKIIFEEKTITGGTLLEAIKSNYEGNEVLRQQLINKVPKYGNDVASVDETAAKWVRYFADLLKRYENYRGGRYQMGLYTVSAHVPMGRNVGATPDGRLSGTPLADGGLSPMTGRDRSGPTAVLRSVSRIASLAASNGTLLNLKFMPSMFREDDIEKFSSFLKTFIRFPIHHVQFNVIDSDELNRARKDPESYKGLTIRVAGYTAFFTELSPDLQDEIIRRTEHGE